MATDESGGGTDPLSRPPRALDGRELAACGAILAAIVFALFRSLLLGSDDLVISSYAGDTARYFYFLRLFGFEELRSGNLPLWNPHLFSGIPFLANFQSALLYPPNAVHLLLSTTRAINVEAAFHLWLIGITMYGWARGHRLQPLAAGFAAITLMFSAPFYLRIIAGQLGVLEVVAWAPLLLLSIDRMLGQQSSGWCLVGIATTTLMLLAGHPPTVLMTAGAAGLYCLALFARQRPTPRGVGLLVSCAIAPLGLAAAQLWPGLELAAASLRAGGTSYDFATSFSFPPENLLTLAAPGFFGSAGLGTYFGRWFYWDASAFMGTVGLALAIYGARHGTQALRRPAAGIALFLGVVALGRYSPLYGVLHALVPGLDHIRSPSKFMFQAMLFTSLLAGMGADRLLRQPRHTRGVALTLGLCAVALAIFALPVLRADAGSPAIDLANRPLAWFSTLEGAAQHPEAVYEQWTGVAQHALVRGVAALALVASLLWWVQVALLETARSKRWLAVSILALGTAEMIGFAHQNLRWHTPGQTLQSERLDAAYQKLGDGRALYSGRALNAAMAAGGHDIWGYDPTLLSRYVEFIAHTQGRDPGDMDNISGRPPRRHHRLLALLRCRLIVTGPVREPRLEIIEEALPHLLLVREYRLAHGSAAVLAALDASDFDPTRMVVLEQEPVPAPDPNGRGGTVRLVSSDTDELIIEADLPAPAILLITDVYDPGWRATPLEGSDTAKYSILPADHVLRAIPLSSGRHRLRVEYAPGSHRTGQRVSLASLAALTIATGAWGYARVRHAPDG